MKVRALLAALGVRKRGLREEFDHRVEKQLAALGRPSGLRLALGRRKGRRAFKKLLERDPEFYVLYRGAAISATWLSAIAVAILNDLGQEKESPDEAVAPEQAAALAFFSRLANDLFAIIELVERGFDLQARGLARSFLEHVDVLICCIHDRELTEKFVNAREPNETNQFWHQHISKNKIKRRVSELIAAKIGLRHSTIVDDQRAGADEASSAILHPTIISGFIVAFGDEDVDYDNNYPVFPQPISASGTIFRTILVHLFWLFLMMGPLPRDPHGAWGVLIREGALRRNAVLGALIQVNQDMHGFMLDWQVTMRAAGDADGALSASSF
jgi:hypothetical protein